MARLTAASLAYDWVLLSAGPHPPGARAAQCAAGPDRPAGDGGRAGRPGLGLVAAAGQSRPVRWPSLLVARGGRVRLRGVRTFKSTLAAVTAYVVALPFSDNPRPVLAPLTALLVVQLTLYETVRRGLLRVVSVVLGVLFAAALSTVVPLTWWSLGLAVAVSLVIGRLFRLGDDIAEVPISAMLILAVGGLGHRGRGPDRRDRDRCRRRRGRRCGRRAAAVRPAGQRRGPGRRPGRRRGHAPDRRRGARPSTAAEQADAWLAAARGLGRDILRADRVLGTAETSLRYNPRAISRPHAASQPAVRPGRGGAGRRLAAGGLPGAGRPGRRARARRRSTAPDVRAALSDLLADVADAVESYGSLVGSEVVGPGPRGRAAAGGAGRRLGGPAPAGRAAAARRTGWRRDEWQLHGQLTTHIDQLLRDVDSEARAELRRTWPAPAPVVARLSRRRGR